MLIPQDDLYMVFWEGDFGDSESHSAYYTDIVRANSKDDAIKKYVESDSNSWSSKNISESENRELKINDLLT